MQFALDAQGRAVKKSRKSAAFYLADDLQTRILVRQIERSIGFPTVRLEVGFGQ
jgi:hypothetical protein